MNILQKSKLELGQLFSEDKCHILYNQFHRMRKPYGHCGTAELKHFETQTMYTQQKYNIDKITDFFLKCQGCHYYGLPGKNKLIMTLVVELLLA